MPHDDIGKETKPVNIDRERWREIQAEFGQDDEPLGHPRVHLTEEALTAEFGDGENQVSVWATQQSTRVDVEQLQILTDNDTGRVVLLRRIGPYPIQQWEFLYDSNAKSDWHAGQSLQDATSAVTAVPADVNTAETDRLLKLVQQLLTALRAGLGLYYQGQVDETDPAVRLVEDQLLRLVPFMGESQMRETAVRIVRTVRSMVPTR